MSVVIGWDVGGAHLKGARAENGRVVAAVQIASPLWLGLSRLDEAFRVARTKLGQADEHAVTMTGELSMAFPSRAEGVAALASLTAATLAPARVRFYAGRAGFVSLERVGAHAIDIASANWHASAALVARHCRDALFIDMGSTTTDIIPVVDGAVAARGYTDAERLVTGELAYVGLVRTLVLANASLAPFDGKRTPLMNEDFANMADVHRIIGDLPEEADLQATTDGRDKSVQASRMRLARMVGRDASERSDAAWLALARWLAERQLRSIADAAMLVLSDGRLPETAPIVAAGIGVEFLRELSDRLGRKQIGFDAFVGDTPSAAEAAAHFAPAAAVALLASTI
ncbi:MAG: hydantoinase/oxoprolinase family protein [Roseiarcus sp.]|jgi:probable H4MPT-linked C1 transfer pathway protein